MMADKNPSHSAATVTERMIRLRHDIDRVRCQLVDLQVEFDEAAQELAALVPVCEGDIRWVFHDAYVEGAGYLPYMFEIWPNGQVQMVEVEKALSLKGPGSAPPVAAHAATAVGPCHGEGEVPELDAEMVQAALRPDWDPMTPDVWARSRARIDTGDTKCTPN